MLANKLNYKTDPMKEMEHLRDLISNESFSMQGIVHSLQNLIPSIQKNFQSFVHSFSEKTPAVQLKSSERDFMKLLDGRVYLNLSPLMAFVPEGLVVPYIEYLAVLKEAVQHCHDTTLKTLNEYSMYLAQIITNRQFKITTMPHDKMYATMEKARAAMNAKVAKCFKTGSTKAEATYADVVNRNAEWVDVFHLLDQVGHIANTIPRDDLHKKADECNNQLEIIIKQIRNNEFEGAGPEVTNNLSNGAYQSGSELEFFAATYFRVLVITTSVGDTMQKVTEVLKQAK